MDLKKYAGKRVKITTKNPTAVFIGPLDDYIWPEDNENGKESVIIVCEEGSYFTKGTSVEFYESDIYKIEILEKK